jgi:hypothetical protein
MHRLVKTILILVVIVLIPAWAAAWGEKGHLMINRMAINAAGSQLPEFMEGGRNQLIYEGPEPDRWRDEVNSPMAIAQAPDHFFDSEYWGPISTLVTDRYAFMAKLEEKKVDLIKIGYLPYSIMENYGRLRNAFRQWRAAKTPEDREAARVNALVYGGLLGHYVGDGSNPMHLSFNYNGWDAKIPNPNGYRTMPGLHSQFESAYVNSAIEIGIVQPKVKAPQRLANVFGSVRDYLSQSFNDLEPLYALEKSGEFNPENPKAKGTDFVTTELARGATMLGNLWYTAWLESGEPAK